jgi:ATP-dependent Clp protease adaptor protein ClpS
VKEDFENELEVELEESLAHLKRYKVLLLNDDYTSMDFVVDILMELFEHPLDSAINTMLSIHKNGRAVSGVYTYDIAETKIVQVSKRARENDYPLKAIMEEE